jgi:hypothetical protein
MARKRQRLNVTRLAAAKALFAVGVVALVAGAWLAFEWWLLASCTFIGIALFALSDVVASLPERTRRRSVVPLTRSPHSALTRERTRSIESVGSRRAI